MSNLANKTTSKELTLRLQQGIQNLFESDSYAAYLKTMSRFHAYSTRNTLLIHMQKPNATLVTGYRAWQTKFKRYVKEGEKAIKILAPVPFVIHEKKEKLDTETRLPVIDEHGMPVVELTELRLARFKAVNVFDVSQTDGEPLPTLVQTLSGDVEQYAAFMDALRAVSPLPIVIEPLPEDTDGKCVFGDRIILRAGMSEIQTVCAAIHEITHAKLHDIESLRLMDETATPKDRRTEEVEAESVSYVVCQHFGIETGTNSFGYVAQWSKTRELKELNASLDTIRKTAADLIETVGGKFQELVEERGIVFAVGEGQIEFAEQMKLERTHSTLEYGNYQKLSALFPQVANREYRYMRLESGDSMMPLSLEWLGDSNRLSVMHTYTMNGDLMYDPMMVFEINGDAGTMTAVEYEQSYPPLYQRIDEDGTGLSVDGNGNQRTITGLQAQLNDFSAQWFDNIGQQGYLPLRAIKEIDGEDVQISFDADGNATSPEPEKQYDLNYGHLGNGLTVWNRLEEKDGDYVTVAHIGPDRAITFYDKDLPDDLKAEIELTARTSDARVSTSQPETRVFDTPPQLQQLSHMPDPAVSISEMNAYGYTAADMLPLTATRALELFEAGHSIYMLYPENDEAVAFDHEEIITFGDDGIFGIEKVEWEASVEFAQMRGTARNSEGSREAELLYGSGDRFGIYQIHDDTAEARNFRFVPMRELEALSLPVDRANYKLVYTAPLTMNDNLDQIFADFNDDDRPVDFTGRSVSVSDIIVLKQSGDVSSHYVDSVGFVELDAFLGEERQSAPTAEKSPQNKELDSYSQVGNKATESAQRGVPKAKPSLMERLEEGKRRVAQQGQSDPQKNNSREVV